MGGSAIRLGPFSGGLNTVSDPTTIADTELAECLNLEQDLDGSLQSRPPFKEILGHSSFTERVVFLCEAIFGSDHYLIASNTNGVFHFINGVFTLITSTFEAGAAVQYADKIYLVPKPGSGSGGKWDPAGGFVAVAAIPKGQAAVVHKERLFVCPGIKATVDTSRLKFSEGGDLEDWPAANFIDVRQGDGTKLVDLTIYQDNLLLFKEQSTHILSYDTAPSDASLKPISRTIGVNRQWNVVNYESQIYVFSQGWVYEITNLDFVRLNTKVPFIRDDTTPSTFSDEFIFLSLLEDRLICRFYRNVYVYGLRTRTWSQWQSAENRLHYFGPIMTVRPSTGNLYYSGSCVTIFGNVVQFFDQQTSSSVEEVTSPTITISDDMSDVVSNSWGSTDTSQDWIETGGAASDYSKDGTDGLQTNTSVAVTRNCQIDQDILNPDITATFTVPVVATGNSISIDLRAREQANNDRYRARMSFDTSGTFTYSIAKIIGSTTVIVGPTTFGSYSAGEKFTVRLQINGTSIKFMIWRTLLTPPANWTATVTDSAITVAGKCGFASVLNTGNTNTLPVIIKWDNIQIGNATDVSRIITCQIRTKNFDMAVSHQFKRLWWWGASVSSNNAVVGTLYPITSSFVTTWDDMTAYTWDNFNTWDFPIEGPAIIETSVPTSVGTSRQAVKFNKAIRYIQVAFGVKLTTKGDTIDGPAKIFTLIAWTDVKQIVSKAVS